MKKRTSGADFNQSCRIQGHIEHHVPKSKQAKFKRAASGKLSPRSAIKLHCEQCVGFENIKEGIGKCTACTCVLWAYRPYQDVA
jgi:hypothetical protein